MDDCAIDGRTHSLHTTAIANQFRRHRGLTERSNLFETFDHETQEFLLQPVSLESDEKPVFAHCGDGGEWFVESTNRVWWSTGGACHQVRLADLRSIDADWRGRFKREAKKGTTVSEIKSSFSELTIEDCNGGRATLRVESGAAFYAMHSALHTFAIWACSERQEARSDV